MNLIFQTNLEILMTIFRDIKCAKMYLENE